MGTSPQPRKKWIEAHRKAKVRIVAAARRIIPGNRAKTLLHVKGRTESLGIDFLKCQPADLSAGWPIFVCPLS
jgi:hypothetical protein